MQEEAAEAAQPTATSPVFIPKGSNCPGCLAQGSAQDTPLDATGFGKVVPCLATQLRSRPPLHFVVASFIGDSSGNVLSFQKYFKGNVYQRQLSKNGYNKPSFVFISVWGRVRTTGTS